jgi:hypothetical protein
MKRLPQKIAAVLLVGMTLSLSSESAVAASFVPQLAGTWEITGTPDASECGPSNPFTNLSSISVGGALVNSDPVLGTSLGEVYRLGRKTYAVGFFGLISVGPGAPLRYEVQGTLKMINPGEAAGRFRTILPDPTGVNQDCIYEGTIQATRLVPMPY